MASTLSAGDPNPSDTNPESGPRKIVLHILCPQLPRYRWTFHDFTLSSTVARVKARISESVPGHPTPASQRLIYCGKPVANDDLVLQNVLEPVEVNIPMYWVIHLLTHVAVYGVYYTRSSPSSSDTIYSYAIFHRLLHYD